MVCLSILLFSVGFVRLCGAQSTAWQANQINTTMCYWSNPRAAVIRDTLYLDGGALWWEPGFADGSSGPPASDGNPLGYVYLLNFSQPFNTSQNLSTIFTTLPKGGSGLAASNIGPQYFDGGMLANDYEWHTYGGVLAETDAYSLPDAQTILTYQAYANGPPKTFTKSFVLEKLPAWITRYVTEGGAVSVPSENLGFYFAGLRSRSWGKIFYNPGNETVKAQYLSNTLLKLDMSDQTKPNWSNATLPSSVPGRVNPEIVWVPVSKQGVLIAIGGVTYPYYATMVGKNNASAIALSKQESPVFMSTVSVYDIATSTWFEQPTTGAPGQLTQGCTIVASAQDGTSHNIYWYGGFDGLDAASDFNDDVWILSVPSFMWMKVHSGTPGHGRAGHKCARPYPDQMFVIGGYTSMKSTPPTCLDGGVIQIFNLTSNQWITNYDPTVWGNYSVPQMISLKIGGTSTGSATQTAPSPSGFADSNLTSIFGTPYNSSKIKNWYPYTPITTPSTNRTTLLPTAVPQGSGTPKYLIPVVVVVVGLFLLTLIILAILLYRRRRVFRSTTGTQSEAGTMDNRRLVFSWLRNADAKAPTVTTDETPQSPDEEREEMAVVPEMGGEMVHEMPDTSLPVELHETTLHDTGTGFTPITSTPRSRPSNLVPGTGLAAGSLQHSDSVTSRNSDTSDVSRFSAPNNAPVSPVLAAQERVVSGVSNVSEGERGHLRGISETSVSTEGGEAVGTFGQKIPLPLPIQTSLSPSTPRPQGESTHTNAQHTPTPTSTTTLRQAVSPLTPPLGAGPMGEGYIGSQSHLQTTSASEGGRGPVPGSPSPSTSSYSTTNRRKSNFLEGLSEDDRRV